MITLYIYKSQNTGWTYCYHSENGVRIDGPNNIDGRLEALQALLVGLDKSGADVVKFGRPSDFPGDPDNLSLVIANRKLQADLAQTTDKSRNLSRQLDGVMSQRNEVQTELRTLKAKLYELSGAE